MSLSVVSHSAANLISNCGKNFDVPPIRFDNFGEWKFSLPVSIIETWFHIHYSV